MTDRKTITDDTQRLLEDATDSARHMAGIFLLDLALGEGIPDDRLRSWCFLRLEALAATARREKSDAAIWDGDRAALVLAEPTEAEVDALFGEMVAKLGAFAEANRPKAKALDVGLNRMMFRHQCPPLFRFIDLSADATCNHCGATADRCADYDTTSLGGVAAPKGGIDFRKVTSIFRELAGESAPISAKDAPKPSWTHECCGVYRTVIDGLVKCEWCGRAPPAFTVAKAEACRTCGGDGRGKKYGMGRLSCGDCGGSGIR